MGATGRAAVLGTAAFVAVMLLGYAVWNGDQEAARARRAAPATDLTTSTTALRPTTTVAEPCYGTAVPSETSIQAAVDANPSGTTFCLAGIYKGTVTPKSSQRFLGPATLHGAFLHGGSTDVVLRNLTIDATGQASGIGSGLRWHIEGIDVSRANIGITVNTGTTITGGSTHHNGQYGIVGGPLSDLTVNGTDCSFNNTRRLDPNFDAGCVKIHGHRAGGLGSERITFRNMRVHDNYGPGLWCDWSCRLVTYDGNQIWNNANAGIFFELAFSARITNNQLRDNCMFYPTNSIHYCAEILIAAGTNVKVTGNVVDATRNGIGGKSVARKDLNTVYGLASLCNVQLAENAIRAPGTSSGWVGAPLRGCSTWPWYENGEATTAS